MHVVKAICCAAVLTVALAPGARADEWNKKTILTFSGAVQIPGATLPAGSYVFKLADIPGNRHIVQVFDKDEKKIYTTLLAIPNERLEPADKPIVLFSERASGSPQAIKVWYYPGDRTGNEFVYPKAQAMRIAKETHQSVLAMNNDTAVTSTAGEVPASMRSAEVGYFDENGNWQTSDKTIAVTGEHAANTATPAPAATTAIERPAANTAESTIATNTAQSTPASARATGTAGRAPRKHLPRTSSSLALFELLSGLSIGGGVMLRSLRSRA